MGVSSTTYEGLEDNRTGLAYLRVLVRFSFFTPGLSSYGVYHVSISLYFHSAVSNNFN